MFKIRDFIILRVPAFTINAIKKYKKFPNEFTSLIKEALKYGNIEYDIDQLNSVYYKYYSRMCTRPTPFGLMSTLSITKFSGKKSKIILGKKNVIINYSSEQLNIFLKEKNLKNTNLRLYLNPTIIFINNKIRYIKEWKENDIVNYEIKEIERDKYVNKINCIPPEGVLFEQFVSLFDVEEKIAEEFIRELLEEKIIYINDSMIITTQIEKKIIPTNNINLDIQEQKNQLNNIKSNSYNITTYRDCFGEFSDIIKGKIKATLDILYSISEPTANSKLSNFKRIFAEKYETKLIPLLIALDPDLGINYFQEFKKKENTSILSINSFEIQLIEKILAKKHSKIDIKEFEKNSLEKKLPKTMSVLGRVLENENIYIEAISGISGINLMSRFSVTNEKILEECLEIVELEKPNNPNIICANLIYSPTEKSLNYLSHKKLYEYEIPLQCNNNSTSINIKLSDLYIFIHDDYIHLYSKKLKKIVRPRLSNAHDFSNASYTIYRFLGDLVNQESSLNLNLHTTNVLKIIKHHPRIYCGEVILAPETWLFSKDDICCFENQLKQNMKYVLSDLDQELYFEIEDSLAVEIIRKSVKTKESFIIKEYLYDNNLVVVDGENQPYANQFLVTAVNNNYIPPFVDFDKLKIYQKKEGVFYPGTNWIYLKFYMPQSAFNLFLIKFSSYFTDYEIFFVKYADPNFHIRLRLRNVEENNFLKIATKIQSIVKKEFFRVVEKFSFDTYEQELNRYSISQINQIEKIFCIDSKYIIQIFKKYKTDYDNVNNQIAVGIRLVNDLLDIFVKEIDLKIQLLDRMEKIYIDLFEKSEIRKKHEIFRLNENNFMQFIAKSKLSILFEKRFNDIAHINSQINNGKSELFIDIIHMSMNRLFINNQNIHETVVYIYLNKILRKQKSNIKI